MPKPYLCFEYEAKLREGEHYYLHGEVQIENWRTQWNRTEQEAAWAFVRRLLNIDGEWACSVTIDERENRVIEVSTSEDGFLFRLDQK